MRCLSSLASALPLSASFAQKAIASPGEPLRGWVVNRSQVGLGLLVEEALEIGTVVQISPNTPGMNNLWFTVGVIHCAPERIRWRVGVQFGKHMSWDELRLFG